MTIDFRIWIVDFRFIGPEYGAIAGAWAEIQNPKSKIQIFYGNVGSLP